MREQSTTRFVSAPADDVFELITSPEHLPEWNKAIIRVIDVPEELHAGAEWVVQLSALGQSWRSRSTVLDIDSDGRHLRTGRAPMTATPPTRTGPGASPTHLVGAR